VTLVGVVDDIAARALTPREAVQRTLDRIDRFDPSVNAYITVRAEEALAEADAAPAGLLHGAPIAVKDVIDVAGSPTTAGTRLLVNNRPSRDAVVVARLRAAGAIVVGKLNTHEFAYGPTTTSSHIGPTHNPWSLDRIAGGSSGGSAAATAAGLAVATLGTDTAGSIRMPAALCGVTALRPSPGLVSRRGVIPVAQTFDTVGPIARSAEDCALLFSVLAGQPYRSQERTHGLRVGVVQALVDLAEPGVAAVVDAAICVLADIGTLVDPVEIPLLMTAGAIQQSIMLPEAASWHLARLRTSLGEYSVDVRRRLLSGLFVPATSYLTGLRMRSLYRDDIARVFERYDVLVAPTMPCTAPPIRRDGDGPNDEYASYRRAVIPFNAPWTVAGHPVLSVPCGFSQGLPVGLSLVGRPYDESTVLGLGRAFQAATNWHERLPTFEDPVVAAMTRIRDQEIT
jgi:aspartyl-tRNA(Asn)/glutamyl-tRNA(Gln) amidotransferase subunit A